MTGLDPETDCIIEIATIVTDGQLNVLAEGPSLAIHQPETRLQAMDEWNTTHHSASGLWKRVLESDLSVLDAEQKTLQFLEQYVDRGVSPMCGNSVCQDRRFLVKGMPQLESYFHYRHIDVSTLKELMQRWSDNPAHRYPKKAVHLALADIRESIEELRHYRGQFFNL